ncbi:MAG TPA: GNAT family N-acetyltransferase [Thermoanaerobaculia bacterium]
MIGDAELARRLESFQAAVGAEMADALNRVDPTVKAATLAVGDGAAVFAGAGSPLTQATGADRDVELMQSFFFEHRADSIIQVNPWSPPVFMDALTARQYRIHEFENVFGLAIKPVEYSAFPKVEVFEIEESDIPTWARIGAEAFASEEMSVDFLVRVMTPFAYVKHARCYIAYVDGEPAGSAAMFALQDRKVAGLFGAGTRERFRKRGVQSALLQRRLADAGNSGCDIAMVTTLPGSASHRNVARRGFELLYTKISMRLPFSS